MTEAETIGTATDTAERPSEAAAVAPATESRVVPTQEEAAPPPCPTCAGERRDGAAILRLRAGPDRAALSQPVGGKGVRPGHRPRRNRRADRPAGAARRAIGAAEPLPRAQAVLGFDHRGPGDLHPAPARSGGLGPPGRGAAADAARRRRRCRDRRPRPARPAATVQRAAGADRAVQPDLLVRRRLADQVHPAAPRE